MSSSLGFEAGEPGAIRQRILQVKDGMDVIDSAGEHIGKVTGIRVGDPNAIDVESYDPGIPGEGFALAMGAHREPNVPRSLVPRLLREGYIKIDDKRRFRRDHHYYALADQIESVDDQSVHLARTWSELIPALDE